MSKIEMGKTYKTREGNTVRVLCVDSGDLTYPVVAVVSVGGQVNVETFTEYGVFCYNYAGMRYGDLVEYSPWNDVAVDTKILVRVQKTGQWLHCYYAGFDAERNLPRAFNNGQTSYSSDCGTTCWQDVKIA